MTATLPNRARVTSTGDILRGLAAAIALVVFVVGLPLALVALAPTYLPDGLLSWSRIDNAMTSTDDGTLLFAVIAAIAWLAWAAFTLSVIVEGIASLRRVHAPHLPLIGGMQHTAGRLIATAGILLALTSTTVAHAPAAHAVPAAAPERLQAPHDGDAPSSTTISSTPNVQHSASRQAASTLPSVTVERGDTLWGIAERHLGAGSRYTEIRELNADSEQPGGGKLTDADWILPGWHLTLPADATGIHHAHADADEPTRDPVQTVIVQPGDSLWDIAAEHLGDGQRYREIARLNHDRVQADGQTLRDANLIRPGWVLALPAREAPTPSHRVEPSRPTPVEPDENRATRHDARLDAIAQALAATDLPTPAPAIASPPAQLTASPQDGAHRDATSRTWFLGLTALGAAGLVGEIARRRHLQQRARKLGEGIPLPAVSSPAARAERTLRSAATPVGIAAITTALKNLGCQCYDAGRELPRLGALLLDEDHLTMLLIEDDAEPPSPFTAVDSRTWTATTTSIAQQEPVDDPDQCAPFPLLVTLGHTDRGTLIVNLEAAGTLTITGDPTVADDILRALVVEAATSQLAGELCICLASDDELVPLTAAFEPHRLRVIHADDERTNTEATVARTLKDQGLDDTLQARGDRQAADTWLPVVFIERELISGASAPWSGAAVISRQPAATGWTLTASGDGSANLAPIGMEFRPQRLRADQLADVQALLDISLPPATTARTLPRATVTHDDVEAVREAYAATPPAISAEARITIRVLGPIEIDGLPPGVGPLSPRMTELLVYLALHGPTTGADLDDVLWGGERIRPGTRNALVYRTRRAVGEDVLPLADKDGRFRLAVGATTDWQQFKNLLATAPAEPSAFDAALTLVRDRPFRGIGGAEYAWADYDIQQMTSAITDSAAVAATQLLARQDPANALSTALHGMQAAPYSETLQRLALAAAEVAGGPSQQAALRARFSALLGELDPELAP